MRTVSLVWTRQHLSHPRYTNGNANDIAPIRRHGQRGPAVPAHLREMARIVRPSASDDVNHLAGGRNAFIGWHAINEGRHRHAVVIATKVRKDEGVPTLSITSAQHFA
ncbi:hypothetical protein M0678_20790 [Mycobacterium colombiense]|nr:hypothetical protein [Mycobacterium colombiense]